MANIPSLPTGRDLLAAMSAGSAPFGPTGLMAESDGTSCRLIDANGVVLAKVSATKTAVALAKLDPATVPYVNKFVADFGKVEKNWRPPYDYRVKGQKTVAPVAATVPAPAPVVAATPAPVTVAVAAPLAVPPPTSQPVPATVTSTAALSQPVIKPKHRVLGGIAVVTMGTVTVLKKNFVRMNDAWADRQAGRVAAVAMTGPSGTAKTLAVKAFAQTLGVEFVKVDGGTVRQPDDWFGTPVQDPVTGIWSFVLNRFGEMLRDGHGGVVLLDEANRADTPQALNAFLGLLDETASVYVASLGTTLTLPQGLLLVVSANKGSEYVGTVPFDAAVTQRFNYGVRLDYPIEAVEVEIVHEVSGLDKDLARSLVKMANAQRPLKDDLTQFPSGVGISPRMLVEVGRRIVQHGTDTREALDTMFDAQFEVEDQKALTIILDTYFPTSANATLDVDTGAITEG